MKTKIDITETRVYPCAKTDGRTKAFAHIILNGALRLGGLRVIDGENGLFVAYPSEKSRHGEYYSIFNPINRESRSKIQEAVLEKFENIK